MPRIVPLLVPLLLTLAFAACDDGTKREPSTATGTGAGLGTAAATAARRAVPLPPQMRRQAAPFDPASFQLTLDRVADGLAQPLFLTHAGDGSGRLFVVEKRGTIRIVAGGVVAPEPFLDIRAVVRSSGSEQGLLGLAFHPRFTENGRFYVMYTAATEQTDNTVAEFRLSSDPNRADPASGRTLLAIPDFAANHNGGMVAFGPDGYLYVGTGDGGGAGDPQRNGQNGEALLGKLLRLDVDGAGAAGPADGPYGIPPDNPFAGRPGFRPEVWAYGLRNPWRFSFDRQSGDLWIADVGQNAWEEINLQPAGSPGGENYGWSIMEGSHCFRPRTDCDRSGLTPPVAEYSHDLGCSVTGGYVSRAAAAPALWGAYLYGDYCSGRIWALYQQADGAWTSAELLQPDVQISSFGEDEAGELYLVDIKGGAVYRLGAAGR